MSAHPLATRRGAFNVLAATILLLNAAAVRGGELKFPPYLEPKVVFDVFLADPQHLGSALHWVRSYVNPLTESPYDMAPEFMEVVIVIHGTEVVTLASHNYEKYRDIVDRMRYYASLGVHFRVCGLAAAEYGYNADSFYDFVEVVPSAMVEIADLQRRGYGLIIPQVHEKRFTVEELR